ncbi:MAG: NAD(+)/NADH kinase [Candidatus Bathyarchaeia archaeon]
MKAGVISRTDLPEALAVARTIVEHLESRGVDIRVETETALALDRPEMNADLGEMDVDFIVAVGGDGTILRTAMLIPEPGTPILGVNLGSRGFLTEILPGEVEGSLDRVLEGDYIIDERVKLSSRCLQLGGAFPDSLNEVLVASSLPSKVLEMSFIVDGEHIIDVQADGAIVATPTGSTAYSLSAGGSIVVPEVPAMILTAICPTSYFRSLVAPLSSRIRIELLKPKADALAIVDGRVQTALKPRSTVEVWASPHRARFIRFRSFYSRLERRLTFRHVK